MPLAALLLLTTAPPVVYAALTGAELRLLREDGGLAAKLPTTARELAWSPDGARVAVWSPGGELSVVTVAKPELRSVAQGVEAAGWTRDGRLLFGVPALGVFVQEGAEPPRLIVPRGRRPAPNPTGSRIAFALEGRESGGREAEVWTSDEDGANPRRVRGGKAVGGVSWSSDGRLLAFVLDGRLVLARPNGRGVRDLGAVEGARVLWSPGGAELLVRRSGAWNLVDAGAGTFRALDLKGEGAPAWVGPSRVIGVRGGAAFEIGAKSKPLPLGNGLVALARVPGVFLGRSLPDPFAGLPTPREGRVTLAGKLVGFDPVAGTLRMRVESLTDARGRTTVYERPEERAARVSDPTLARRLTLPPETELAVTLSSGGRGGEVVSAVVPDAEPATAPPPAIAGAPRAKRAVEYDGVTRERVVVPLVYPIPGRHSFTDTFLAPRDGGKRRHHGNDLMAPKMTPLLAVFDGRVSFARTDAPGASNMLTLTGDDGWTALYLHINNDTPGTDDGRGSLRYAFPADLQPGDRVRAGEIVAWCGDSGNAEDAGAHLHFELHDREGGAIVDPAPSLEAARRLPAPLCPDPDASLKAGAGEARLEGIVASVSLDRRTVTLELTAEGAPLARAKAPRLVYVLVPEGLALAYRGPEGRPYRLEDLRPGVRFGAVGPLEGGKLRARAASFGIGRPSL